jgi:kynurenine formamidase
MINRREIMAVGAAAPLAAAGPAAVAAPVAPDMATVLLRGRPLRVLDLTHKLTRAFAFTPGRIAMEAVEGSGAAAGMTLNRLCIVEHTGTHLDAPRHFSPEGAAVGDLTIDQLVAPLAIVDIRDKARTNRDARVGREDLLGWERRHGRLPPGACVAMLSGWNPLAEMARYGALPAAERRKSPGFDAAAVDLLVQRDVRGIGVDTLSLDAGESMPAYPVHQSWLRSGRWGLEALANLDRAPQAGGLLFVGAPPVDQATGMPVRVIALY